MQINKIENHVELAVARELEQWIGKENIEHLIVVHAEGYQDLENVLMDIRDKTFSIPDAEGVQLDLIGKLIGQERLNFDDDFYRILILARIGINVSNGEPERIINTIKLLTKANNVHYMNLRGAEIALGSDGVINPLTVEFLISNLQRVVMGGVRVDYLAMYDEEEAFSLGGTNQVSPGVGFGEIDDINLGGMLAELYTIKNKFSFSGNNTTDEGFGDLYDPLVGGVF